MPARIMGSALGSTMRRNSWGQDASNARAISTSRGRTDAGPAAMRDMSIVTSGWAHSTGR